MHKKDIHFSKVLPNKSQINILFELLKERSNNISHSSETSFEEHKSFVEKHPYRVWYLLTRHDLPIGSIYLTNENSIGINMNQLIDVNDIQSIFEFVQSNYSPLPAIKSIRRKDFHINVSPENQNLLDCLKSLNKKEIQSTFLI